MPDYSQSTKMTGDDPSETKRYRCFAFSGAGDSVFINRLPKGIQLRGLRFKNKFGLNAVAIAHSTTGRFSILFFM